MFSLLHTEYVMLFFSRRDKVGSTTRLGSRASVTRDCDSLAPVLPQGQSGTLGEAFPPASDTLVQWLGTLVSPCPRVRGVERRWSYVVLVHAVLLHA